MAITLSKIILDKPSRDGRLAVFLLTDGTETRRCVLSGLTDNDTTMRAEIAARADEVWGYHAGSKVNDGSGNIETSRKTFNTKKPDKADVRTMNSIPELRSAVADLIEAVEALKELIP